MRELWKKGVFSTANAAQQASRVRLASASVAKGMVAGTRAGLDWVPMLTHQGRRMAPMRLDGSTTGRKSMGGNEEYLQTLPQKKTCKMKRRERPHDDWRL